MNKWCIRVLMIVLLLSVAVLGGACRGKRSFDSSESDSLTVMNETEFSSIIPESLPDATKSSSTESASSESLSIELESLHIEPGSRSDVVYKNACRYSLGPDLESVGLLPVFCLNSMEDATQLCRLFPDDYQRPVSDNMALEQGLSLYDNTFFVNSLLFVFVFRGSGSYQKDQIAINGSISNRILHLDVELTVREASSDDSAEKNNWVFVPISRSDAETVISYDVSFHKALPGWAEPVKPDWRGFIPKTEEFDMVRLICDEEAKRRGLSEELELAGTSPILCLESAEDVSLFCSVFQHEQITEATSGYDDDFFENNVLFAIYLHLGTGSYQKSHLLTESVITNQVLHFRIRIVYPENAGVTWDDSYAWMFVPMEKSRIDQLIAYDASWWNQALPPDWTEPVNPDWRN